MHRDPAALPFVDEHGVEIAAPPEVVWESLCRVAEGSFYALVFHLAGDGAGTRLRAETRARFPGTAGRLYRTAVIGTRGHVLVTMRLLNAVKRRAERDFSASRV